MQRLFLIDAHALIHRVYHALPPLTDKGGAPAGALYGLASVLLKILRPSSTRLGEAGEEKSAEGEDLPPGRGRPDYIMAFFDRPEPTLRKQSFEEYKIHRPKAADELVHQLIHARELFEAFGIKTFESPGYEADDLIGAAVTKFRNEENLQTVIVSGDLDLLQLVQNDRVLLLALKKGMSETTMYNEAAVVNRFGIPPHELPEYKGLVGDSSDNIPGVAGIGPKTAQTIIQTYHTLENFLKSGQNEKCYEKIKGQERQAFLSRDLARLHDGIDLNIKNLDEAAYPEIPIAGVTAYMEEKGFTSLVRRLANGVSEIKIPKKKKLPQAPGAQSLFG